MSNTARLLLPYIAPQQAQKQVTYNEAMATLDMLVQPAVKSRTVTVPPATPAEGDAYIVAPSATGAWAGKDGKFAAFLDGGWDFRTPGEGWLAFAIDTTELAVFTAGAWTNFFATIGSSFAKLGINATADLTNRLSIASTASLFSHAGAGHQLKLNKASAADTASLLYQDNFSGRAELGLAGDDHFHLKVSPDGATWFEALVVDRTNGRATIPTPLALGSGQLGFPATQARSADPNTLDDYEEGTWTPTLQFGGAATGITYGSPTLGRYTKIGRLVTATANLTLTSKGSATGNAEIAGLPFTALNDGISASASIGFAANLTGITGNVLGLLAPNTARIALYAANNGAASAITNTHCTNTTTIHLTLSFEAA